MVVDWDIVSSWLGFEIGFGALAGGPTTSVNDSGEE